MAKYREIFVGWWITGLLGKKAYVTYSINEEKGSRYICTCVIVPPLSDYNQII